MMAWAELNDMAAAANKQHKNNKEEKVKKGVDGEEVYGKMMRRTKGNIQHILMQPTAESTRKRLGLMLTISVT